MTKRQLNKAIRDTHGIWYGPHECNGCGRIVVKKAAQQGGLTLDAQDHNHNYPNFKWVEHVCQRSPVI